MRLVSGREFARLAGVSEGAVRKALNSGRIVKSADGRIDADTQLARFSVNRDEAQVRTPVKRREHADNKSVRGEDIDGETDDSDEPEVGPGNGALYEARVLKERYLGKLRKQEFDVRSGKLVEKATVKRVFFESARQFRDAVCNMPMRIGSVQGAALAIYIKKSLSDFLTPEQAAEIDSLLDPVAIQSICIETMDAECRAIMESLADSEPPEFK